MMSITLLLSLLSVHFSPTTTTSSPTSKFLGPRALRPLLLLRSLLGALGIWGFYYSLQRLSLATATTLNFLAPTLAVLLLGLFPGSGGLSKRQLVFGAASMGGVVCVVQPWSASGGLDITRFADAAALGAAGVGVLGGAGAYVCMARIGRRVDAMVTVGWFASSCILLSLGLLLLQPGSWRFPKDPSHMALAAVLGVLGFVMHALLTKSLAEERQAARALNFVYTQIVFAMGADWVVWGVGVEGWKWVGAGVIVASALGVVAGGREGGRTKGEGYELVSGGSGVDDADSVDLEMVERKSGEVDIEESGEAEMRERKGGEVVVMAR